MLCAQVTTTEITLKIMTMKLFNSKLLVLFLLPACVGCKNIHTELFIPAEPEIIWSVLMDETSYKNWHSVLIPLEGEEIKEGNKLKYTMTKEDGKKIEICFFLTSE